MNALFEIILSLALLSPDRALLIKNAQNDHYSSEKCEEKGRRVAK